MSQSAHCHLKNLCTSENIHLQEHLSSKSLSCVGALAGQAHLVELAEGLAFPVVAEEEADTVGQAGRLHSGHALLQLLLAHSEPRP